MTPPACIAMVRAMVGVLRQFSANVRANAWFRHQRRHELRVVAPASRVGRRRVVRGRNLSRSVGVAGLVG